MSIRSFALRDHRVVDDDELCGSRRTSSIYLPGQGKTRSDAHYKAISDCNEMMTFDLTHARAMNLEPSSEGSWGAAASSPCHITRCYAPARARRAKGSSR
jgi:hypothetical protein